MVSGFLDACPKLRPPRSVFSAGYDRWRSSTSQNVSSRILCARVTTCLRGLWSGRNPIYDNILWNLREILRTSLCWESIQNRAHPWVCSTPSWYSNTLIVTLPAYGGVALSTHTNGIRSVYRQGRSAAGGPVPIPINVGHTKTIRNWNGDCEYVCVRAGVVEYSHRKTNRVLKTFQQDDGNALAKGMV